MSLGEIVFLMALALILFGPEDLPVIARTVGRVIFEIRKVTNDLTREFQANLNVPTDVIEKAFQEITKESPPVTANKATAPEPGAVAERVNEGQEHEGGTENNEDRGVGSEQPETGAKGNNDRIPAKDDRLAED